MEIAKEKVPGKLVAAGVLMIIYSAILLVIILLLLLTPFVVSWVIDVPVGSMSDMLVGWMNSTGGSADPGPIAISIMTVVAYLILVLLIFYLSLMMAYGIGFVRGRLTRRPPYYLAVITLVTVIIPPWGAVIIAFKVTTGILMLVALRDDRVRMLYERAKDPYWELKIPPVVPNPVIPPNMTPEREVVSAVIIE